jgi:hypothetical protein
MKGAIQSIVIFAVGMTMISTLFIYSIFTLYTASRIHSKEEIILSEIDKAENVRLCMLYSIYYSYINALDDLNYESMWYAISATNSYQVVKDIQDKSYFWLSDVVRRLETSSEYSIKIVDFNITYTTITSPYLEIFCTYYLSKSGSGNKFTYYISNLVKMALYIDADNNRLLYYEYLHP